MRKTSAVLLLPLLLAAACQRQDAQEDRGGDRAPPIVLPLIQ